MAATSPAFMVTRARGAPVFLSATSQTIVSDNWTNHSTRSLPWKIGRIYSSVVGQNRLALHTEVTEGFQVTSERDKYLNRLKPHNSSSKPGSARISGSSCATSWNWRLTGH